MEACPTLNEPPTNDVIDECLDDWCPECYGDDVIDLPNGDLWCRECRKIIDE